MDRPSSSLISRFTRALGAACLVAASTASHADIVYQFDFSGISGKADFSVTLQFSNYVTTSGMQAVVPTAQNSLASLGYAVNYAGTNKFGWWGFDDDTNGDIDESGYLFGGDSFLFQPNASFSSYLTAPGVYAGFISGNSGNPPAGFSGQAVLTIRETGQSVPEPGSIALALLALGAGVVASRRRPA